MPTPNQKNPSSGTFMAETLRQGLSVERVRREDTVPLPSNHYHDYYEIYYLLSGRRRFFIKDTTWELDKGALVLIRPNTIHRTLNLDQPGHERILVNFRAQILAEAFGDENALEAFRQNAPVFRLDPPGQFVLEEIFSRLYAEFRGIDSFSRRLCPVLLCELAANIARLAAQLRHRAEAAPDGNRAKFQNIARYISENYTEKLTLRLLSGKFYLSPFHLCRRFKETTGFSIIEYLNNVRVIEAQRLLRETDLRIAELAGLVGFENISHFGRTFKKLIGTSPLRYRRLSGKGAHPTG
jgi:AraC-like DNA-binding protein